MPGVLIDGTFKPPYSPTPEPGLPEPVLPQPKDPHDLVAVGTRVLYAKRGKIVVQMVIRNVSGMVIRNLPVWCSLKQDITGVGASYGYLSIETKPRYISLKAGDLRTETFEFIDERITPGTKFVATVYTEYYGKTYSARVVVDVPMEECADYVFQNPNMEVRDVTSIARKYNPKVKKATLTVFRKSARIVKNPVPGDEGLYRMWKRGYTLEKKRCPIDGKYYTVQYSVVLKEVLQGDRGENIETPQNTVTDELPTTNNVESSENPFSTPVLVGLGVIAAAIVIILLGRR